MQPVLRSAKEIMERHVKDFVKACLNESSDFKSTGPGFEPLKVLSGSHTATHNNSKSSSSSAMRHESSGLFSLGIIIKNDKQDDQNASAFSSRAARSTVMGLSTQKFCSDVLFAKTNNHPQIRHALFFRKPIAKWTSDIEVLKKELATVTGEDTSAPSYSVQPQEPAIDFLDNVIKNDLLPVLQEEAVDGTVRALERADAFDPVLDRNVYARSNSNEPQDVDMCKACNALYVSTGPLFLALHRLPSGGEMYLPLVAVLEHVILTFISRVKQQVGKLCNDKTALQLLMDSGSSRSKGGDNNNKVMSSSSFGLCMERRRAFSQLVLAYADGDLLEVDNNDSSNAAGATAASGGGGLVPTLLPPPVDTPGRTASAGEIGGNNNNNKGGVDDLDLSGGVEREEHNLSLEMDYIKPFLDFSKDYERSGIVVCSDEDLMKAACLSHSLLKLAGLLESRIKVRSNNSMASNKTLTSTRALREAIKTIKANGLKLSKFCRADVLMQT
jgi:hypothetical protein